MMKSADDPRCGACKHAQKHPDLDANKRRCMEGYGLVRVDKEACKVFVGKSEIMELENAKS